MRLQLKKYVGPLPTYCAAVRLAKHCTAATLIFDHLS